MRRSALLLVIVVSFAFAATAAAQECRFQRTCDLQYGIFETAYDAPILKTKLCVDNSSSVKLHHLSTTSPAGKLDCDPEPATA
ncbi:hypothetical protein BH10PSE7_BH10PSE7_09180 [soil metagenome]